MSYEIVRAFPQTSGDDETIADRRRESWPNGQIYFEGNDAKTKKMWDEWSDADAYPLITKVKYILKQQEFATKGRFEISNPYSYKQNAYVRGGLAWTATYYYAFKQGLASDVPFEDELYATSDFDTVACTAKFDIEDFNVDMDTRLSFVDENANRHGFPDCRDGGNTEKGGWPYRYCDFWKKNRPLTENQILNVEAMNTRMLGTSHSGLFVSWTRLASFFGDKLRIGKHRFITKEVDEEVKKHMELRDIWIEGESEYLQDKYSIDFGDDRHENNVNVYPSRYGLANDVPYLMRVEGFGFVETPTVQIGQILDSLSDYQRCAEYPGIAIKEKYARRLARIKHAFRVHESVKKSGYTEQTSPFVLSDAVVEQYERYREDGSFSAFEKATDPEKKNCRRVDVDETGKKVTVYGEDLPCDRPDVRMNCASMMKEHPFKEKGATKLYDEYSAWTVESTNKRKT